jgi:hypothetical protein
MTEDHPSGIRRIAPALGLLVLAPVTAEYLYGYDDSTGSLDQLVGGLVIFAPLYGGAALIIREISRRTGRGWPAMLLLGLGFGVLEAGLIDHSMFNPFYRDIEYWDAMFAPTFVPALGVNPNIAMAFTTGHLIWSIAIPIAITEALVPERRTTPWLGKFGLATTVVGFLLAASVVIWWHLEEEAFVPSAGQLLGAATVVVALTVAALRFRRRLPPAGERPPTDPWRVGAVTFALLALPTAVEFALELTNIAVGGWPQRAQASWFAIGWDGFVLNLALLASLTILVVRWSGRTGWGPAHLLAVASGALLANVVTAFATEPIGAVSATAKYAHNTVALFGVAALLAVATLRQRRVENAERAAG